MRQPTYSAASRDIFPVLVEGSSFSVLLEKEDGKRYRQHFTLTGNRVSFDGEKPQ